jgi:hypothetical protein
LPIATFQTNNFATDSTVVVLVYIFTPPPPPTPTPTQRKEIGDEVIIEKGGRGSLEDPTI